MQENKSRDFNPLDILATAAALKCGDKRKTGDSVVMTQQKDSLEEEQKGDTLEDNNKRNSLRSQNAVRKLKVVTVCSDLEKMFDEHNYGNSRKSNKSSGSWSADISPPAKDRKVIVTVVDRSGDHRVVKTFNSIKLSKNSGKTPQGNVQSGKNNLPIPGESIKISCGELSIDNSGDNHTCSQGSNSSTINVNKEENLLDQVDLFTCTKQVSSDNNDSLEGHSQNTSDSRLIHNTSACQSRTDSTAVNSLSSETSVCSDVDKDKINQTEENRKEAGVIPEVSQPCGAGDANIVIHVGTLKPPGHNNTESKCENLVSKVECSKQLDSQNTGEVQASCDSQNWDDRETNNENNSNSSSGNGSQVNAISLKSEHQDNSAQSKRFIITIGNNSACTPPDINEEKGVNSLFKSTESNLDQINTVKSFEGDKCLDRIQNNQDCDKTFNLKLGEKPTSQNCDCHPEKNEAVMSPLGIDSVPVGCSSCFRHFEDTSDSESWRNDGVPGRSDVRLSLDLDSPKSEGVDNFSSVDESSCNTCTLSKYELESNAVQKISDLSSSTLKNELSDTEIPANSENKNYPSCETSYEDKESSEMKMYVDPGDHCYAGISSSQKRDRQRFDSLMEEQDNSETDSSCDLSQDSGFGEVGQSPKTLESMRGKNRVINKDSGEILMPLSGLKPDIGIPAVVEVHNSRRLLENQGITPSKDTVITILKSPDGAYLQKPALQSQLSPSSTVSPVKKETSPTFGKYSIGTFASVSNLAVGLDSAIPPPTPQIIGVQKVNNSTKLAATSLLTNAVYKSRNLPLHLSSIKSGESLLTDKINASQSIRHEHDTSKIYKNHIEHDHDYCASPELESFGTAKCTKDAIIKVKSRKNDSTEKRLKKAVIDTESLDMDSSNDALSLDESSEPASPSVPTVSHNHGTRQKLKAEKIADYVKSGCSDSKLKITGSFQDDYIYFLNTKLRSRRRTTSQDYQPPFPPDKIFVPLPKPGDIVVPHLTDADLEAIRQGRPTAAKPTQRCPVSSSPSTNIPNATLSSSYSKTIPLPPAKPVATQSSQPTSGTGSISDEESKIINTILSMENCEPSSSQGSVELPGFASDTSLFGSSGEGLMNLTPESINLTPEQMEILYSAMDEVQSLSPDISKVDNKFSLDEPTKDSFSQESVMQQEENKEIKEDKSAEDSKGTTIYKADPTAAVSSTSATVSTKSELDVLSTVDTDSKQVLTSVACPGVTSSLPDISFSSLDKSSLDIFGGDLKLFPEANVDSTVSSASVVPQPAQCDNAAPWIVTVSMYWNDLPAIMIDNLPYVRLVDIHKQILPAKDTGILKKRCQLLGIEVKNCTEMQRYFLVQYGKAFNSKSTLIVGKDCAKALIGYYVNPAANPNRTKDTKAAEKQSETYLDEVKATKSGNILKSKQVSDSKMLEKSELLQEMLKPVREIAQPSSVATAPVQYMSPSGAKATNGQQLSTRTRHKKINFLEMLKGDSNNNTEVSEEKEPIVEKGHNSCTVESTNVKVDKSKIKASSAVVKEKVKVAQSVEESEKPGKVTKIRTSSDESVQVEMSVGESESENKGDGRFGIGSKKRARQLESNAKDKVHLAKKLKLDKKKAGPLKVKWTIFNKTNSQKSVVNKDKLDMKQDVLAIVHKDMVPRNGHRGRIQAGNVLLNLYEGPNSSCVKCCTCKKLLTVDNFLKHLHETGGSGKLSLVNQPQTLAMRDSYPTDVQKKLWEQFQKRKKLFSDNVRQQKLDERKVNEKNNRTSIRHDVVRNVPRDPNVRSSARKRKPKQLHPIENYSFAKSALQSCPSDDIELESPTTGTVDSDGPSPSKLSRILPNLSAGLDSAHVQCEDLTSTSSLPSENVVILQNGPEVISFTALENGFDM